MHRFPLPPHPTTYERGQSLLRTTDFALTHFANGKILDGQFFVPCFLKKAPHFLGRLKAFMTYTCIHFVYVQGGLAMFLLASNSVAFKCMLLLTLVALQFCLAMIQFTGGFGGLFFFIMKMDLFCS